MGSKSDGAASSDVEQNQKPATTHPASKLRSATSIPSLAYLPIEPQTGLVRPINVKTPFWEPLLRVHCGHGLLFLPAICLGHVREAKSKYHEGLNKKKHGVAYFNPKVPIEQNYEQSVGSANIVCFILLKVRGPFSKMCVWLSSLFRARLAAFVENALWRSFRVFWALLLHFDFRNQLGG